MNEPKKCSRCLHADAVVSMDCRRCHYVAIVIIEVHKRFHPDRLEALSKLLRSDSLKELQSKCPPNAHGNRSVYSRIQQLAYPAKIETNAFRLLVADQIMREVGDIKGIANYDAKNGEGSWMAGVAQYIAKCLKPKRETAQP